MLSENAKIFFGEKIWEDCEIVVKKEFVASGGHYFTATIMSTISKLPEGSENLSQPLTCYSGRYRFYATFVS